MASRITWHALMDSKRGNFTRLASYTTCRLSPITEPLKFAILNLAKGTPARISRLFLKGRGPNSE